MRIAIAPLKVNFAGWLSTNACKKRAFVNRAVDKIQTTVTVFFFFFFSYFCESLVCSKQHGFKIEKLLN